MEASRARAVRDGATSALALVSSEITRAKADADQWHARRKGWITGAQRHGAGACAGPRGNERERERDRASSVGTPQSAGEAWRREVEDKSDSRWAAHCFAPRVFSRCAHHPRDPDGGMPAWGAGCR